RPLRGLGGDDALLASLPVAHLLRPRRPGGGPGPARAAIDGGRPGPDQADRLRHLHRDRGRRGCAPRHHPAGAAVARARVHRPRLRDSRARRDGKHRRHARRRGDPRRRHLVHGHLLRAFTGYVNFGSAAFFALGAYSSIVLDKLFEAPITLSILSGTAVAALVGLGMGYLTLRLRGVFFAIATLAFAEVLFTFVVNWD